MFRFKKKYRYVRKFKIKKLSKEETESGRCINCAANGICGRRFSCPCEWGEHLIDVTRK